MGHGVAPRVGQGISIDPDNCPGKVSPVEKQHQHNSIGKRFLFLRCDWSWWLSFSDLKSIANIASGIIEIKTVSSWSWTHKVFVHFSHPTHIQLIVTVLAGFSCWYGLSHCYGLGCWVEGVGEGVGIATSQQSYFLEGDLQGIWGVGERNIKKGYYRPLSRKVGLRYAFTWRRRSRNGGSAWGRGRSRSVIAKDRFFWVIGLPEYHLNCDSDGLVVEIQNAIFNSVVPNSLNSSSKLFGRTTIPNLRQLYSIPTLRKSIFIDSHPLTKSNGFRSYLHW